jgi:hypothetical protein
MTDYIDKLRMKPAHIRRRIATGTAAGFTALVAVVWIGVTATSGAFTLAPAPAGIAAADAAGPSVSDVGPTLGAAKTNFTALLGAASASFGNGSYTGTGAPASGITIQTEASTTVSAPQPTSIPF